MPLQIRLSRCEASWLHYCIYCIFTLIARVSSASGAKTKKWVPSTNNSAFYSRRGKDANHFCGPRPSLPRRPVQTTCPLLTFCLTEGRESVHRSQHEKQKWVSLSVTQDHPSGPLPATRSGHVGKLDQQNSLTTVSFNIPIKASNYV
jgi:hypothetical protein